MSAALYNYQNEFISLQEDHSQPTTMKLDDSSISKFKVAKEFLENKARINALDFSQDGMSLISSSDDDTIIVYDCEKGIKKRDIFSKKYGVDLIKFTHASNTAIHTSTKENDTIRYLSLHDNKYLRYFVGHEKRVVTLCMSPADDTFISGSLDNSIRLWDLRQDKHIGRMPLPSPPIVNYDPEGLIFAVGLDSETIRLYDARNYDKGPFNTIKCTKPIDYSNITWTSLKFSPNGKQILITSNMEQLFILDAFTGQPQNKLVFDPDNPMMNPIEHPCEGAYTPDAQFILCGGVDGSVHVWSSEKGTKVTVLKPARASPEPVQAVMFNPKFMLLASACSKMSFWIPTRISDY